MFILAFIKHKKNSKKLYCFSEILIENTRKKNNWAKLAKYVFGQMRIVQNNLKFIFRFVQVER